MRGRATDGAPLNSAGLAVKDRAAIELRAQPGQRERTQGEAEVAESDVEIAGDEQQIDDDGPQPSGDYVGADARTNGDNHSGNDLNHSNEQHETVTGHGEHASESWSHLHVPIHEEMSELVEAGEQRRNDESNVENLIGLIGRIGEQGFPQRLLFAQM